MKNNVHVVRNEDRSRRDKKWVVKLEGRQRPRGHYRTQQEAIEAGRELSRENSSALLIHGLDGKIRDKLSSGTDPRNING